MREPYALKGARTVPGRGCGSNPAPLFDRKPTISSADPGYATYDNYQYLEDNDLYGLISDKMHFIETHGRPKYYPKFRFPYDPKRDQYTCPAGRTLRFVKTQKDKGGELLRLYQGNCSWCPLHLSCTKASRRTLSRHPREGLIRAMRARLATPEGKTEYAKRITVAEAPFGNMKANHQWRQTKHRGGREPYFHAKDIMFCDKVF